MPFRRDLFPVFEKKHNKHKSLQYIKEVVVLDGSAANSSRGTFVLGSMGYSAVFFWFSIILVIMNKVLDQLLRRYIADQGIIHEMHEMKD